jgi:uncharacterized membrane protein YgaE (UPF0421/DUF939 family)
MWYSIYVESEKSLRGFLNLEMEMVMRKEIKVLIEKKEEARNEARKVKATGKRPSTSEKVEELLKEISQLEKLSENRDQKNKNYPFM